MTQKILQLAKMGIDDIQDLEFILKTLQAASAACAGTDIDIDDAIANKEIEVSDRLSELRMELRAAEREDEEYDRSLIPYWDEDEGFCWRESA